MILRGYMLWKAKRSESKAQHIRRILGYNAGRLHRQKDLMPDGYWLAYFWAKMVIRREWLMHNRFRYPATHNKERRFK